MKNTMISIQNLIKTMCFFWFWELIGFVYGQILVRFDGTKPKHNGNQHVKETNAQRKPHTKGNMGGGNKRNRHANDISH